MARLIARLDKLAGYVYFRSGDKFAIPEDARQVIKRNGGEFSGEDKEWRVGAHRGGAVVDAIQVNGHQVIKVDTDAVRHAEVLLECGECQAPYPARKYPEAGEKCRFCNAPLTLVPAHQCGPECAERARPQAGGAE